VPLDAAATTGGVASAAARMRELGGGLTRRDGVRVFTGVYLSVTDEIARRVAAGGFADPEVAGTLAALFAGRYLDAVRARRPPACWRPLLRMRAHPGLHPLQFALAGVNAHIGHDLPLAVVDTCRRTGIELPALKGDFDRVGVVLAQIETRVREELMPGPDLLEAAEPLTHLAGTWSLARARDAAWASARLLWALRGTPRAYAECERRLDGAVAVVGRFLLTPVGG
jgi:hypothetical protein